MATVCLSYAWLEIVPTGQRAAHGSFVSIPNPDAARLTASATTNFQASSRRPVIPAFQLKKAAHGNFSRGGPDADQMPAESFVLRSLNAPVLVFNMPGLPLASASTYKALLLRPGLPIGLLWYVRPQRTARREDGRM